MEICPVDALLARQPKHLLTRQRVTVGQESFKEFLRFAQRWRVLKTRRLLAGQAIVQAVQAPSSYGYLSNLEFAKSILLLFLRNVVLPARLFEFAGRCAASSFEQKLVNDRFGLLIALGIRS